MTITLVEGMNGTDDVLVAVDYGRYAGPAWRVPPFERLANALLRLVRETCPVGAPRDPGRQRAHRDKGRQ